MAANYKELKAKGLDRVPCPECEATPQRKDLAAHMEAAHGVGRGAQQSGKSSGTARVGTKKHRNQERHNRAERNHKPSRRNGSR
ncbi:hypothetical protein HY605_02230 [Candidatus Peregrinibacteria bacterium]|nr:hypothetical protein [Candidatus Peregrinibacteria bacterium]